LEIIETLLLLTTANVFIGGSWKVSFFSASQQWLVSFIVFVSMVAIQNVSDNCRQRLENFHFFLRSAVGNEIF
jgi:hypothetical protein